MFDPRPELPDDTPIVEVLLPESLANVLLAAGMKTVGEVREASDEDLMRLKSLDSEALNYLRLSLGLPSSEGVSRQV